MLKPIFLILLFLTLASCGSWNSKKTTREFAEYYATHPLVESASSQPKQK